MLQGLGEGQSSGKLPGGEMRKGASAQTFARGLFRLNFGPVQGNRPVSGWTRRGRC